MFNFFLALIVILYSSNIIIEKCYYISTILCTISKNVIICPWFIKIKVKQSDNDNNSHNSIAMVMTDFLSWLVISYFLS